MKKVTAVEWLYNNLKSHFEHDGDLLEVVQFSFKKAKEMENERAHEYAEFAIRCDREGMKILNFDGFIKLEK